MNTALCVFVDLVVSGFSSIFLVIGYNDMMYWSTAPTWTCSPYVDSRKAVVHYKENTYILNSYQVIKNNTDCYLSIGPNDTPRSWVRYSTQEDIIASINLFIGGIVLIAVSNFITFVVLCYLHRRSILSTDVV